MKSNQEKDPNAEEKDKESRRFSYQELIKALRVHAVPTTTKAGSIQR